MTLTGDRSTTGNPPKLILLSCDERVLSSHVLLWTNTPDRLSPTTLVPLTEDGTNKAKKNREGIEEDSGT